MGFSACGVRFFVKELEFEPDGPGLIIYTLKG